MKLCVIDKILASTYLKIKINSLKELFVEDQGSTNGVKLNGQKIKGIHKITNKDIVEIGSCKINVKVV